jgi:hypothetical protein
MDWETFWKLWLQKILRNFASMKFQLLMLLYATTVWGMFHIGPDGKTPWVSATVGFAFLGGGFITLASARIIARTKLTEPPDEEGLDKSGNLDTER